MIADPAPQVGVMFDATDDRAFPTLDELLAATFEGRPPVLAQFLVIAADPARSLYFDDEAEAIDVTNYTVIKDIVAGAPVVRGELWTDDPRVNGQITAALEHGAAVYRGADETFLIVAPDRSETISRFEATRRFLADYPLLDESAYYDREHDAWCAFQDDGLRRDTTRDLRNQGVDDDTVDTIEDAWTTLAPLAAVKLGHHNGFTGEHHPPFPQLIAELVAEALVGLTGPPPGGRRGAGGGGARALLATYARPDGKAITQDLGLPPGASPGRHR